MIEVLGVEEPGKEMPTATDAEQIYKAFKRPMDTLQELLKEKATEMENDGVSAEGLELSVSPSLIVVRIGEYTLFHEIRHWVTRNGVKQNGR